MSKTPKFSGNPPDSGKKPRIAPAALPDKPVWKVGRIDFDGPWCPKKGMSPGLLLEIIQKLKGFENSTWSEIIKGGSHSIDVNKITKEARERLQQLRLDDTDQLFSLRLSGKERIWGLRFNNVFSVLWWDPEHQICPALLKNT